MDVFIGFTVFAIVIASIFLLMRKRKRLNPPPGPKGYPLIGNTFDLDSENVHLTLSKWADICGDIFEVNLFGSTTIVLNNYKLAREAFVTEPNATIFANRVQNSLAKELYQGPENIGFADYSENLVKKRKLGHKMLKAYGEGMKAIEDSVHSELETTMSYLKKLNGEAFDPESVINGFLCQIVAILLTGRRFEGEEYKYIQQIETFAKCLNEMFTNEAMLLLEWLPFMRYVPCKISRDYYATKKVIAEMKKFHLEEKVRNVSTGLIHEIYKEFENQSNGHGNQWLTPKSVYGILSDLTDGGIISSRAVLLSAVRILLDRMDIQKKLQEEVDNVVGSERLPSLSDRKYMPYTEAFLLEVMRYANNFPLFLAHCLSADTTLSGFDLNSGSTVLVNGWKIYREESVYHDPYEFKPERFLDESGDLLPPDSPERKSFLTFGAGKRTCIGEAFAKSRLFLFISTLLQHFKFMQNMDDGPLPKFDPNLMKTAVARVPLPYRCRCLERNS